MLKKMASSRVLAEMGGGADGMWLLTTFTFIIHHHKRYNVTIITKTMYCTVVYGCMLCTCGGRTYVLPSSEYQNHVYSPRDRTIFSVFRAHLSTIYPYPPRYDIERGQRTAMMYVYIKYTIFIIYVPQVYMSTSLHVYIPHTTLTRTERTLLTSLWSIAWIIIWCTIYNTDIHTYIHTWYVGGLFVPCSCSCMSSDWLWREYSRGIVIRRNDVFCVFKSLQCLQNTSLI